MVCSQPTFIKNIITLIIFQIMLIFIANWLTGTKTRWFY